MNIAVEPSRHPKLEDVQWVLRSTTSRRKLRHLLKALLYAGSRLGPCYLRHARYRPGHRLTAYYDVRVHCGFQEGYLTRPIAVTWGSSTDADQPPEAIDIANAQAAAMRRGLAAPFLQLIGDFPEWSMQVWVSPLDVRFPQLVRVSDPLHVPHMLADAYTSGGTELNQDRLSEYTVTPIRYRPGKRHVLRYTTREVSRRTVFAKLYTGDDGSRAFRVARQVADWLAARVDGVSSVRPLAYLAEDTVVLYPRVFGAPLSRWLRRPNGNLAQCLERAGSALRALHSMPEAVAGPLELHDFAAEIRQVVRATRPISVLLPQVGAEIDALLDRARGLYERLPEEPPTFTHGDFKSEHLYVAPGRLTLIDFDTSRWADPALDVGKFLADLRLWYAFFNHPGLEQAQESFLAGYAPGAPMERLTRARLYEAVELVKLTARRIRLFEDDWASRTARLVGHARALTDHLPRLSVPGQVGGARGAPDLSRTSQTYRIQRHPASAKGVRC